MTKWQAIVEISENVSTAIGFIGCAWAVAWFLVKSR